MPDPIKSNKKQAPVVTGDGHIVDVSDVHFNTVLAAPEVSGVLRFTHTSDALRGLVREISERAQNEGRPINSYCAISGRSGHSRIGIDVQFTKDFPEVSDKKRTIEFQIVVTALNRLMAESLTELQTLAEKTTVDLGRLFIPMSESLSQDEVMSAIEQNRLLLPKQYQVDADGVIELPLEDVRYILSERLTSIPANFSEMIVRGKHGLNLFQNVSPAGLSEVIAPKEFLVGAIRISLGPYTAFIQRELSDPGVFHLASRLLDGIRTSGLETLRQVELYNWGDEAVPTDTLRTRIRLYPAEEDVARIADRILTPGKERDILQRGADFTELTDIFDPKTCHTLFDEISTSPGQGAYGRLVMPGRVVNIPWEQEEQMFVPEFQWRLVYESVRGNTNHGVLLGDEIPKRFRHFIDGLKFVGGEQNLSRVFVADSLPPVDTLRVIKRNGIGVVLLRSLSHRDEDDVPDLYLDQAAYEELCRLEHEGMRFYLCCENGHCGQVREFHKGFWVTEEGKQRIDSIHTTVAMFGSAVSEIKETLEAPLSGFFHALRDDPRLGENLAVAHGSGPGVMQAVDDVAADLDIFRFGVGIDGEKLGQITNMNPEAVVHFVSLALNTRQDILDRRSLFKIFNIGGYGTSYEINMALTFMKIGHCLPAPYIFIDPLGLGGDGAHLWSKSIEQFTTLSNPLQSGQITLPPMGPEWVARCCHMVRSYEEGYALIKEFIDDPAAYWRQAGVSIDAVRNARQNLICANVPIPPYIDDALENTGESEC